MYEHAGNPPGTVDKVRDQPAAEIEACRGFDAFSSAKDMRHRAEQLGRRNGGIRRGQCVALSDDPQILIVSGHGYHTMSKESPLAFEQHDVAWKDLFHVRSLHQQ